MKVMLNDRKKIFDIQVEFNAVFPYLKLEFFSTSHVPDDTSRKFAKYTDKTLGECRILNNDKSITIYPDMTVATLEKTFQEVYGLEVQVFRQSGKAWLETTITDGWTLEEQNRQGEALSKPND